MKRAAGAEFYKDNEEREAGKTVLGLRGGSVKGWKGLLGGGVREEKKGKCLVAGAWGQGKGEMVSSQEEGLGPIQLKVILQRVVLELPWWPAAPSRPFSFPQTQVRPRANQMKPPLAHLRLTTNFR